MTVEYDTTDQEGRPPTVADELEMRAQLSEFIRRLTAYRKSHQDLDSAQANTFSQLWTALLDAGSSSEHVPVSLQLKRVMESCADNLDALDESLFWFVRDVNRFNAIPYGAFYVIGGGVGRIGIPIRLADATRAENDLSALTFTVSTFASSPDKFEGNERFGGNGLLALQEELISQVRDVLRRSILKWFAEGPYFKDRLAAGDITARLKFASDRSGAKAREQFKKKIWFKRLLLTVTRKRP